MEQSGRGIGYYFDFLLRRFTYWFVPSLLIVCVGLWAILSLPRLYVAEAIVLLRNQQIPSALVAPTVNIVASERIQFIMRHVITRPNLLSVARAVGLPRDRPESQFVERLGERFSIEPIESGPLAPRGNDTTIPLIVSFEHESPTYAAAMANELVALVIRESFRSRRDQAAETEQFLRREVDALGRQLASIDTVITTFAQENRDSLPSALSYQVASLEARETEFNELESAIRSLDDERRGLELEFEAALASEGGSIQASVAALKAELAQRSLIYSDVHPVIRLLKQQIAQAAGEESTIAFRPDSVADRSDLPPNLLLIAERIDSSVVRRDSLAQERASLLDSIRKIRIVVEQTPEVEAELRRMERQREAVQSHLDAMAEKLAMAGLGERLETDRKAESIELLEKAAVPTEPSSPNRRKLLVMVLGLAGIAGLACAYVAEIADRKIRTVHDLGPSLQRLIARIPNIDTPRQRRRRRMLAVGGCASLVVFTCGSLATAHIYLMPLDSFWSGVLDRFGIS